MTDLLMETLFRIASQADCDELYVTAGDRISVRSKGSIACLETQCLTPEDTIRLMKVVTPEEYRNKLELDCSVQFGCVYAADDARFHLSLYKDLDAIRMVVRRITE